MPVRGTTSLLSPVRMSAVQELLLLPLTLLALQACLCHGACVEVDSDTEAVANEGFKLGCISCKKRGEVPAVASVNWYFKASDETEYSHLCSYENEEAFIIDMLSFEDRLAWNGSKHTRDLQDGSIYILNVTYNDTGTYKCMFNRILMYSNYEYHISTNKTIVINVVPRLTRGMASILSEVMMYVSIIGLQLWLVVEMIYCYRKISAAGEEALRESAFMSRKISRRRF
ncbi:sodium channel, voltage-gated, type I, beta a isoform X2 [Anabas testudineus]|uniref:Sodium channel regulatory subunit beta-3 n=1 Tax=Anabas testudineus TaxID=64144 RepID=A0A3Q1HN34_ANATE|nr:sodium channel, voltage-gated, type I, beta a isoform X2 [Anabas testudineus]